MELVYLWLEKFGDKSNQEINFNQNLKFSVEKKEEENYILNLKENEIKIPENYFGENISNISCVIGENGSGKTTLIKELFKIKNIPSHENKYILIFKENNEYSIKSNIAENKIDTNIEKNINSNINETYIYFANDFIPMIDGLFRNDIYDISPKSVNNFKTIDEIKKNITGYEYLVDIFNSNAEDIAKFIIKDWETFIKLLPEKSYKSLIKKVKNIKNGRKLWYELNDRNIDISNKKFEKLNLNKKYNEYGFLDKLAINIWDYIFKPLDEWFNSEKNTKLLELIIKLGEEVKKIVNFYNNFNKNEDLNGSPYKFLQDGFKEFNFLPEKELFDNIIELVIKNKINIKRESILEFSCDNLDENFSNNPIKFRYFNFKFQDSFSSGEYSFFYLLEKIFNFKTQITSRDSNKKAYIFILEELENFLHPEWQRRLIELLRIIGDACSQSFVENKIQFILTSHTPFLIGDLPKGNIKRIENFEIVDINHNPLGANLLDILKEQFQLESLFGEFTRKKIKKYLPTPQKDNVSKEELQFLIENIREPLIKNSLIDLYKKLESREEKIYRLEKEITEIKKNLRELKLGDK